MTTIEINLPDELSIRRNGADITMPLPALTPQIVARLVVHGLEQKVGDAAAGATKAAGFDDVFRNLSDSQKAKVTAVASGMMLKVWDTLASGEWGVERGVAESMSDDDTAFLAALASNVKKTWIKNNPDGDWTKVKPAEKLGIAREMYDKATEDQKAAIDTATVEQLAVLEAQRKSRAIMRDLELDLDI